MSSGKPPSTNPAISTQTWLVRALEGIGQNKRIARKSRAQEIVIASIETRSLILRSYWDVVASIPANCGVEVNAELRCMGAAAGDPEPQEQDCLGIHIRSENERQHRQLLKRGSYRASAPWGMSESVDSSHGAISGSSRAWGQQCETLPQPAPPKEQHQISHHTTKHNNISSTVAPGVKNDASPILDLSNDCLKAIRASMMHW